MESTIYNPKQLLWFIILHLGVDVHSCLAVFMSSKVLDGLWINTSIEKVGDVSVSQLMWGHIKVQRISDFGLIFLGHAQRWGNRVFDALPIHILIIVAGLTVSLSTWKHPIYLECFMRRGRPARTSSTVPTSSPSML